MDVSPHQPNRPFWDCACCGKDWPCDPAREHLAATSGGSVYLAILMWSFFEDYILDLGQGPLVEAFERFLGWARRPKPPAPSPPQPRR